MLHANPEEEQHVSFTPIFRPLKKSLPSPSGWTLVPLFFFFFLPPAASASLGKGQQGIPGLFRGENGKGESTTHNSLV